MQPDPTENIRYTEPDPAVFAASNELHQHLQNEIAKMLSVPSELLEERYLFDANYITKYALCNPEQFPHLFKSKGSNV